MSGIVLLGLRFLLGLALYSFLGVALYTLWRDLKRQSDLLAVRQVLPLALTLPDGTTHRFTSPEVLIGREATCDCAIADPTVSLRHARLTYHHNQWWVEDLASTNGTFLNEEQIVSPLVITASDTLRCGHVIVKVDKG